MASHDGEAIMLTSDERKMLQNFQDELADLGAAHQ